MTGCRFNLSCALILAMVGCDRAAHSPGFGGPRAKAAPPVVIEQLPLEVLKNEPGAEVEGVLLAQATGAPKGPAFKFTNDPGAKLVPETLAPKRTATPVPYVERPRPQRPLEMERAGTSGTWLVPLEALAPRGLMPPASAAKPRPLVDAPPLATLGEPVLPTQPPFAVTARAYVSSVDPAATTPLPRGPRPVQPPATAASDPTAEASLAVLLAPSSAGRVTPSAPIRLEVPDPFTNVRTFEIRVAPPEIAAPFAPTSAPRPTLPVEPPKPETKSGGG